MYRHKLKYLKDWKDRDSRKPLVLRGARQVGKSYLVRMFAEEQFENLAEVNFEQIPDAADLFQSRDPKTILALLEVKLNQSIRPGNTLLFLDEIQSAPDVFACLRYFYEQMPQLHVIAAGSLLDFAFEEHKFSMPVGRIEYLHLGPMTIEEFLQAMSKQMLLDFLRNYSLKQSIPDSIHRDLMQIVKKFCVIGGMPEAVRFYAETNSYLESERIAGNILSTFRDDFVKYGRRVHPQRVEKVFSKVPLLVGKKFTYTQVDREEKSRDLRQALHLLEYARVLHRVLHSNANGIPLGAEAKERYFKVIFLDVGLLCRICGLTMSDIPNVQDLLLVNSGAVCEQFVGQHLLYSRKEYEDPRLYCWMRQQGSAGAEVDYLITQGAQIIPVEVKAGKSGSLKSLHVFIIEKALDFALRFNADIPSIIDAKTSVAGFESKSFRLLSLPFYLIGQTQRLCRENM